MASNFKSLNVVLLCLLLLRTSAVLAAPLPCSAPEYHQFDFWVGDWEAFETSTGAKDAHVRVDRILDGCVLREQYDGDNGHRGQSFSLYDSSRKIWRQSWVTNRGEFLAIEGKLQGNTMVLSGSDLNASGRQQLVRGNWRPVAGGVRETAFTSTDGGKAWKQWFDLTFRPAKSDHDNTPDDQRAVAALDTEYQAAVKKNDEITMARLLADDFVLVTGSGKTYRKADLLQEARSGRIVYQHQEDAARTVRVWGDTAVVTAKLWEKGTDAGRPFDKTVWFSDT